MANDGAMAHVRSYAASAEAHAHAFHQLVLPLVGCLELEIGGRGGRVAGGTGALVPPGERHAFAAAGRNEFLVLDLPEHAGTDESLARLGRARFFPITRAAARLAAWYAEELAPDDAPPSAGFAFARLLLRAASAPAERAPGPVRRALAFIEAKGLEQVRISDVAHAAGVSAGHLQALFRAHVGRPPRALILGRRIVEARRLLVETELPIAEIALRCGFADQATLTHAVRRELGATPGALRRHRS